MPEPATAPALKLVDPEAEAREQGVLSFERRVGSRHVIAGRVTAIQVSTDDDHPSRICSLQLLNISDNGVGTMSQEPIAPGQVVTMFFPPHGPERGFDLTGRVIRCTRRGYGHEIGITFAARQAA